MIYINSPVETHHEFLNRVATHVTDKELVDWDWDKRPMTSVLVVLVDNGGFTTLGIPDDKSDYERFFDPYDPRPKWFFLVSREDIVPEVVSGNKTLPLDLPSGVAVA